MSWSQVYILNITGVCGLTFCRQLNFRRISLPLRRDYGENILVRNEDRVFGCNMYYYNSCHVRSRYMEYRLQVCVTRIVYTCFKDGAEELYVKITISNCRIAFRRKSVSQQVACTTHARDILFYIIILLLLLLHTELARVVIYFFNSDYARGGNREQRIMLHIDIPKYILYYTVSILALHH